mmetsp:Transcript_48715/g.98010  ORF Transcript_48715/g.98010 Transcript_48715/m.98010 type:complete len:115 (+) Transcript_48715:431-775(+)
MVTEQVSELEWAVEMALESVSESGQRKGGALVREKGLEWVRGKGLRKAVGSELATAPALGQSSVAMWEPVWGPAKGATLAVSSVVELESSWVLVSAIESVARSAMGLAVVSVQV